MTARLYRVDATVTVYVLSEGGTPPTHGVCTREVRLTRYRAAFIAAAACGEDEPSNIALRAEAIAHAMLAAERAPEGT